jgi:hypothetical protein
MPSEPDFNQTLCADNSRFSLHVAARCTADDRQALEQPCRYITRLALPSERVQTTAAGQVALKLKMSSRDGTTQLVISPLDFRQRLEAAVQRLRRHQPMTASRLSISAVGRPEWVGKLRPRNWGSGRLSGCDHHHHLRAAAACTRPRPHPVAHQWPQSVSFCRWMDRSTNRRVMTRLREWIRHCGCATRWRTTVPHSRRRARPGPSPIAWPPPAPARRR